MSNIAEWPITDPQWNDTKLITLQKILQATVSGGGGGGGGSIQVYEDRNPAAPANTALAAVSYSSTTGVLSHWSVANQSWG